MKTSLSIKNNTNFESIKHTKNGIEYWYARELMPLLDYNQWRNFHKVILKAQQSLTKVYPHIEDHFIETSKLIKIGAKSNRQATREIIDYKLTRYACYVIAQNGDSRKNVIALAQVYFATQTRKQEERRLNEKNIERITARRKLSETEKKFGSILKDKGIEGADVGAIKSAGDEALFGQRTQTLKHALGIQRNKPLADHLPTISIKAKDLAMEMTTFNTQEKDLEIRDQIRTEHVGNNISVRKMLNENGIYPERLSVEEDIKKLEKIYTNESLGNDDRIEAIDLRELIIDIRYIYNKDELFKIKNTIRNNRGNSNLTIFYDGDPKTKILKRDIEINAEVLNNLKKYLVNR